MTPEAHLQACMELLDAYERAPEVPADALVQKFYRGRRYIGSHDKKAITEMFYHIIRIWGEVVWLKAHAFQATENTRGYVLAYLMLQKKPLEEIEQLFRGSKFGPSTLTLAEQKSFVRRDTILSGALPPLQTQLPAWLQPYFNRQWRDQAENMVKAFDQTAPLDLRVNPLKANREEILARLHAAYVSCDVTPYSPYGIRIPGRVSRVILDGLGKGAVEVQDEASQLAAFLADARPGAQVLDLCAGAGGKALAMAGTMQGKGVLMATDVQSFKLDQAKRRLREAGAHNASCRVIDDAHDPWLARQKGRFDRVFVDAPCSGSGTWRRNPDLKWKLTPEKLAKVCDLQAHLLRQATVLVKPGGRLIYATCSILAEENQMQVERVLKSCDKLRILPVKEVWTSVLQHAYPFADETYFNVNPAFYQMDGFFAAVFEKIEP